MTTLSTQQKKDYAKILYTQMGLLQKEAAVKAGVSAKTMSAWVNNEGWDKLRASLAITREAQLRMVYAQLNELQTAINSRKEGERYPSAKEADAMAKLAATIKALETDAGLHETVDVLMQFLGWVRTTDLKKAQELTGLVDQFIKGKLR